MKSLLLIVTIALMFLVDFPDRIAAEKTEPLKATVTGYHYEKHKRWPWFVEAKGADGNVYRNSEGWSIRWLNTGDATEIKRSKNVYIGNFVLRMSLFVFTVPFLLFCLFLIRRDREEES